MTICRVETLRVRGLEWKGGKISTALRFRAGNCECGLRFGPDESRKTAVGDQMFTWDGAHNPCGARRGELANFLGNREFRWPQTYRTLLVAAMRTKTCRPWTEICGDSFKIERQ